MKSSRARMIVVGTIAEMGRVGITPIRFESCPGELFVSALDVQMLLFALGDEVSAELLRFKMDKEEREAMNGENPTE